MRKKIIGVILIGVSCLSLSGCEKVEAYKLKINEIQNEKEKDDEMPLLNLDDEIILDHFNGGKYSLTFKNVKKTDKRNEFASEKIKDVIIIDYKFENYSVDNNILISEGIDYKVYDQNNNQLTVYPITQSIKYPTPASPGAISSGSIALGSENTLNNIKIIAYNQENPVGQISLELQE